MSFPTRAKPLDTKEFTEKEHARELEFHHVKKSPGASAIAVWRAQSKTVRDNPQTGVFKDFFKYGVHPARVAVQHVRLTIPMICSLLSSRQLAAEVVKQRERKREKDEQIFPEEKLARDVIVFDPVANIVRNPPSTDQALELVQVLRKRLERGHGVDYDGPLQMVMSCLNLIRYMRFDPPDEWFVPSRDKVISDLMPLVNKGIAVKELKGELREDPATLSHYSHQTAREVNVEEVLDMVQHLMTHEPSTSVMRELIGWFKIAHTRDVTVALIRSISDNHPQLLPVIEVRQLTFDSR